MATDFYCCDCKELVPTMEGVAGHISSGHNVIQLSGRELEIVRTNAQSRGLKESVELEPATQRN